MGFFEKFLAFIRALEPVEELVLQNQSHRISMILGNNKISERNLSHGLVLMVWQKPEALSQTNNSLQ